MESAGCVSRNKATQELVKLKNAVAPSPAPAVGVAAVQKDKPMVFPKVQPVAPQVQKQNFSVLPKKTQQRVISNDPMLWSEQDFYMAIKKHLVTEDGLVLNGYPLIESKKQGMSGLCLVRSAVLRFFLDSINDNINDNISLGGIYHTESRRGINLYSDQHKKLRI